MNGIAIEAPPLNDSKTVTAWCMYDWAISVYNLVITTTFFPIYFVSVMAAYGEGNVPFLGRTFKSSSLYDYTLAVTYMIGVLILPILSSIADSRGSKKGFLQFFTYLGGFACIAMFWFKGEQPSVGLGVSCLMVATLGYVGSTVFYNSYLPEVAAPEDRDRISARGYSMGYIGSVILQAVGFGLVLYFSGPGEGALGPLYTFLLVGIWWIGFAQITFKALPNRIGTVTKSSQSVLTSGFKELKKVWSEVQVMPKLKWFLVSFLFYSMGVQTVMLAATLFGAQLLGLPAPKLIVTIVLIQLLAIPGAIIMSRLSGKFGNIPVLMGVVGLWVVVCFSAYSVAVLKEGGTNVEFHFYGLAIVVGLVMGGIQSLSRSTYSKLMPVTKDTASYFSFYDVTEKTAIVIGIFSFGYIDELFGMKNSVLILIVFFALGLIALSITNRKQVHR